MVFCSPVLLFGQDLAKDMKDIVENMDSTKSISIKTKIEVYSRKGGTKTYSTSAAMLRQKSTSLNILADQINYENATHQVMVDKEEKSILIQKKTPKKNEKINKQQLDAEIKKLQKLVAKENGAEKDTKVVKLVSNAAGIKKYSITKVEGYKEIVMVIDVNNHALKSISYEYTDESEMKGQYIFIDYTEFKTGLDLTSQLAPSNYFTESKGKYVLAPAYKSYKIYTEL